MSGLERPFCRIVLGTVCAVALLLGPRTADAQIYSWRDANGGLVLSNLPRTGDGRPSSAVVSAMAPVVRTARVRSVDPSTYDQLIERHAAAQGVRSDLVRAIITVESGFDPRARSPKGAMGLMQLMPATAAEVGVVDAYDPAENIRGASPTCASSSPNTGETKGWHSPRTTPVPEPSNAMATRSHPTVRPDATSAASAARPRSSRAPSSTRPSRSWTDVPYRATPTSSRPRRATRSCPPGGDPCGSTSGSTSRASSARGRPHKRPVGVARSRSTAPGASLIERSGSVTSSRSRGRSVGPSACAWTRSASSISPSRWRARSTRT